ncbi:MAG TPA: hypothetical protein VN192_02830 [Flavobacterium sp.]|nr:hypothetical protein [Flavobacterium sp.]
MSTTASKEAYLSNENRVKRESHRKQITRLMQGGIWLTNRGISLRTGLSYEQVHKRTAELVQDGVLRVVAAEFEHGNLCSVYKINEELMLFPVKKLRCAEWLKINHPAIFDEWEKLNK